MLIINHRQAIEWYQFQWPWVTPDPYPLWQTQKYRRPLTQPVVKLQTVHSLNLQSNVDWCAVPRWYRLLLICCCMINVEKPKAYVPPALRGQPQLVNKPKYREAYEPDTNTKQQLAEQSTWNIVKCWISKQIISVGFETTWFEVNFTVIYWLHKRLVSVIDWPAKVSKSGCSVPSRMILMSTSEPFHVQWRCVEWCCL